jgi:hypothetical protein
MLGTIEIFVNGKLRTIELDALAGIQRGLDEMEKGTSQPFRQALEGIRRKHRILRRRKRP